MRRTWRKAKPKEEKRFRANDMIRVPVVFVIDENNERLGEMRTPDALRKAQEMELDLVEVNPLGQPPVVKIMDYGQFKYEKEKLAHKQKVQAKKVEIKGVRLSVRISQHDLELRMDQAKKFLEKGNKLRIELGLRGRERQHPEIAVDLIRDFANKLATDPTLAIEKEQDLTKQGGKFTMILVNKRS